VNLVRLINFVKIIYVLSVFQLILKEKYVLLK